MAEPHHGQAAVISRHRIAPEQIDLLALGKHDAGAIALLCEAERSRRLHALRLVLLQVEKHESASGPLAPADVAWRLLLTAHDVAADKVTDLLNHPQVGVWAAHTLRRLGGKATDTAEDHAPLWFHVGQLHLMAAAAAVHAKLHFQLDVPLWDGVAVLPGVGHVILPAAPGWGTGRVMGHPAGVHAEVISTPPGADPVRVEIHRPHVLQGGAGNPDLTAQLDDAGPYRGLKVPSQPEPLPAAEVAAWQSHFTDAAKLLHEDYGQWARELSAGLSVIVPRPMALRFRPHSASVGDGFGAAIMSEPHDAPQLAVTMVHEFQHSKLNAISHVVRLARDDDRVECYSPWRDDPRPTMGLFQGVFAFTAVGEFWLARRRRVTGAERRLAEFEFALLRLQVGGALGDLERRRCLTGTGRRFVARIRDRIAPWHAVEVPDEAADAARIAALDHQLGWRVSHLSLEPAIVQAAATAWSAGEPAPVIDAPSTVLPAPRARRLDVKAFLMRVLTTEPDEFAKARSTGDGPLVTDAREGDFALVAGNPVEACDLYESELSGGSDRPGAWSGLSCAMRSISAGSTASSLVRRPEVVAAVHRAVSDRTTRPPRPEELAAWLDSSG